MLQVMGKCRSYSIDFNSVCACMSVRLSVPLSVRVCLATWRIHSEEALSERYRFKADRQTLDISTLRTRVQL